VKTIRCKCIPVLLCDTEAFTLNKSELLSLDYCYKMLVHETIEDKQYLQGRNFVNIILVLKSPVYHRQDMSVNSIPSVL